MLSTASLYANPADVPNPRKAAARLARALPGLDREEIRAKLGSGRGFVWIRRHLTPRQQHAVNRLGIPGLDFKSEHRRVYPMGRTASHIVGFTDIDNRGLTGVERSLDNRLRSRAAPLALSIDVRVQRVLHRELARAVERFRALGATGIVMDANSGEVIAMASLPDFDPNLPTTINAEARFNRATLGVYEMGSTFKIFTAAMALDAGTATMRSGYDATDPIRISRFTIRDYHAKRRWLSVPEIFMYSSNIGAVKMVLDVGPARQREFLGSLGMLKRLAIELPETGQPLVPRPWRQVNSMTISFGHGLSVSPLHLVSGVAAVVNGGIYRAPTILKSEGRRTDGRRVMSADTSEKMRRLMRLTVARGTGRKADVPGYLVGGKTGTAEKVNGRRYKRGALLSSFVAAFPMTEPRYVVLVLLDEAKGRKETLGYATGGWVAAPAVGEVVRRIAPLLGVPAVDTESPEIQDQMHVDMNRGAAGAQLASY